MNGEYRLVHSLMVHFRGSNLHSGLNIPRRCVLTLGILKLPLHI